MMTSGDRRVLLEMWAAGFRVREIAERLDIGISTVNLFKRREGLKARGLKHQGQPDDPSPEEEEASQAGLALAPAVARAAMAVREKHFAQMGGAR